MRRRRPGGDWVYRGNAHQIVDDQNNPLGFPDNQGTYTSSAISMSSGAESSTVLWLYDSSQRMQHFVSTNAVQAAGPATLGRLFPAARATGKRAQIVETEGYLFISPSSWAIGNLLSFGLRVGSWEQDPEGGLAVLQVSYSMYTDALTLGSDTSTWADWGNHVVEQRHAIGFNANVGAPVFKIPIRWRGKRSLRPEHGWGIYLEVEDQSVNVRIQPWLRSKVVDEAGG